MERFEAVLSFEQICELVWYHFGAEGHTVVWEFNFVGVLYTDTIELKPKTRLLEILFL